MTSVNVLMVGTGEYTTGYVNGSSTASDKGAGVVALALFDLRRRGLVNKLLMAGTNGSKFQGVRSHLQHEVADVYRDLETDFESFPDDSVERDPTAYVRALQKLSPGDVVTVFTPDDTHHEIAKAAMEHGCHVLIAKPIVKTVDEHVDLLNASKKYNSLVAMEVHKRWDPMYLDARDRIRKLGDFSFFQSYMSQPKTQLETFRAWAGKSSDISFYLNAHHIDFHCWTVGHIARPIAVHASAATGVARAGGIDTEDTITLTVQWENTSGNLGTAVYTSSWIAPRSDVHSQQRFFYMGHEGELSVDQAHRGFTVSTDDNGLISANPLFMKYEPDADGFFAGQGGYGYRSIEEFVKAAIEIRSGGATPGDFRGRLATIVDTVAVTRILAAGRRSLDEGGTVVDV